MNKINSVGETVINAPLPLTEVVRLVALFKVNLIDPLSLPPVVGWNVTFAVQFCPAASVGGQLLVMGKSGSDEVTDVTVSGAVPRLVRIVACDGLGVPTNSVGNVRVGGDTAETAWPFVTSPATRFVGCPENLTPGGWSPS